MGQQDQVAPLQRHCVDHLPEEGGDRVLVLQAGIPQGHEETVLLAVDHLLGVEADAQQVPAQTAGQGPPEDAQQGVLLILGHHSQGLVELGDDLLVLIHITAADVGDAGLFPAEPAADLGDFFFVHGSFPSLSFDRAGAARRISVRVYPLS